MAIPYRITEDSEFSGATIFIDGEPHTVSSDNVNWAEITGLLLSRTEDEEQMLSLINPGKGVSNQMLKLSDRVSYQDGALYFDGDPIDYGIAQHIIKIVQESGTGDVAAYQPLVNFLEKLYQNPSRHSRKNLYDFIQVHGMSITHDGLLLGFKGVRSDNTSATAGYGIVDGVVYEKAHLPNEIGSVVEIPRSMVDTDKTRGCSVGLHVGSYAYASTFSQKLLRVTVNPRDVVSVPNDSNNAKIRVSRYTVIEANEDNYTAASYQVPAAEPEPEGDFSVVIEAVDGDLSKGVTAVVTVDDSYVILPDDEIKDNNKVEEFKKLIKKLQKSGENLRRYKNKRVTAARRPLFERALVELGL